MQDDAFHAGGTRFFCAVQYALYAGNRLQLVERLGTRKVAQDKDKILRTMVPTMIHSHTSGLAFFIAPHIDRLLSVFLMNVGLHFRLAW